MWIFLNFDSHSSFSVNMKVNGKLNVDIAVLIRIPSVSILTAKKQHLCEWNYTNKYYCFAINIKVNDNLLMIFSVYGANIPEHAETTTMVSSVFKKTA